MKFQRGVISFFALLLLLGSSRGVFADMKSALDAVEKKDFKQAASLFTELAESGDVEAQYNLAMLLRQGQGVDQDYKGAAQWFRKAADQGLADAQFHLGNMYEFGLGVDQNFQYAAVWYEKAAKQGQPAAQTNLGVLYASGQGVKQDIIQAYVWLNLAAAQGVQAAFENREIVSKEMSEEMKTNVRKISREYYRKYLAPFQTQKIGHARRPPPPEAETKQPANHEQQDQHQH
ncbi:MAG: sel1 repeat family protein [Gammaproteobacteria bacterium]|nr:sel1 repeat family protein [Gammaproteobacteria bacterium]MDH5802291.1 sel1 repeat family protein [Gammaproteobacteria bacterium]